MLCDGTHNLSLRKSILELFCSTKLARVFAGITKNSGVRMLAIHMPGEE